MILGRDRRKPIDLGAANRVSFLVYMPNIKHEGELAPTILTKELWIIIQ